MQRTAMLGTPLLLLSLLAPPPAQAAVTDVVIDDFKSGVLARRTLLCDLVDVTGGGTMAGGTRRTRLIVNQPPATCDQTNPLRQPASIAVRREGRLVLSSGFKTLHRIELNYGQTLDNTNRPLGLDLSRGGINDRIRVSFEASDLVENFNIVLFRDGGANYAACGMNVNPGTTSFVVDFPFDRFRASDGRPGISVVDYIAVVLQSGSAIGSNDFALRSIVATQGALAGVQTCE